MSRANVPLLPFMKDFLRTMTDSGVYLTQLYGVR